MKNKVCVLVSGGIDSAVLTAEMLAQGRETYPLYVRCGFRWEDVEVRWLRRYLAALRKTVKKGRLHDLTVLEVSISGIPTRHWSLGGSKPPAAHTAWDKVYLPGRNLLLLSQAGVFSALHKIPLIAQGILKGNPFQDATPHFRRCMERSFKSGLGAAIKVVAPYANLTKRQVFKRVPGLPLRLTFSCLDPRGMKHCGKCSKCEERGWVLAL